MQYFTSDLSWIQPNPRGLQVQYSTVHKHPYAVSLRFTANVPKKPVFKRNDTDYLEVIDSTPNIDYEAPKKVS